jgi:hypothetical protein
MKGFSSSCFVLARGDGSIPNLVSANGADDVRLGGLLWSPAAVRLEMLARR